MKKRVLLTLCGIAALAAAIVCLPVSREINTTAAATEYRLDDPAYAVEHTVTIQGRDARNLLGYGHFEGTFAVSGFESGQPGWMIYTVFSNKKSLRTTYSSNPSGEPCTRDLFCLWANRDWSSFAGLIMEVTDRGGKAAVLKELAPALERHPLIASLVVTSDTLPVDRIKVKTAGNLLNVNYKKLASGRK